jgi:hypothetical protein
MVRGEQFSKLATARTSSRAEGAAGSGGAVEMVIAETPDYEQRAAIPVTACPPESMA